MLVQGQASSYFWLSRKTSEVFYWLPFQHDVHYGIFQFEYCVYVNQKSYKYLSNTQEDLAVRELVQFSEKRLKQ